MKTYTVKLFSYTNDLEKWLNGHAAQIADFKISMNHNRIVLVVKWMGVSDGK